MNAKEKRHWHSGAVGIRERFTTFEGFQREQDTHPGLACSWFPNDHHLPGSEASIDLEEFPCPATSSELLLGSSLDTWYRTERSNCSGIADRGIERFVTLNSTYGPSDRNGKELSVDCFAQSRFVH